MGFCIVMEIKIMPPDEGQEQPRQPEDEKMRQAPKADQEIKEEDEQVVKDKWTKEQHEKESAIVKMATEGNVTIAGLARQFKIGRNTVREILERHDIILSSQEQAGLEARETDAKIVQAESAMAVSRQTRQWSRDLTEKTIEDVRLTGEVVVNELRPIALSRGMLVSDLINGALEAEKTLQALKDQYGPQASDFGHDDILGYIHLALRFHRENHGVPLEMEEVRGLIKEFVAEREYEQRVNHLVGLLVSGRKEDKAKFILETQGGQS